MERAVRLLAASASLRGAASITPPPVEQAELVGNLDAARRSLGEARLAAAWAEGSAMTRDQAVTLALAAE